MAHELRRSEDFSNAHKIIFTPWTYFIVALIFAIIIGGFSLINCFNSIDYERDVQHWQEKLNLISESRSSDVSKFISGNFSELHALADNQSLKLYLTELKSTEIKENSEPAQKSYLRNLLLFTAQRGGFASANKSEIPASIPSENKGGLVILDNENNVIVNTVMSAVTLANLSGQAKSQKAGADGLIDLQKDKDGALYMGFSVPIYAIQGEQQIGKIVALKTIDANLFGLLKQAGTVEKTLENLLIRKSNNQYLSPLLDGSQPLEKYRENSEKNTDYRGKQVLSVTHDVAGTNWQLITKIDADEAFAESGEHRADLMMVFTLIVALISLIIIGLWWYSYSRHSLMASVYFRELAAKAQAHEKLLTIVADNQPEAIYMLDEQQICHFSNNKFAETVLMAKPSIIGKKLADILGAARAELIATECKNAIKNQDVGFVVQNVTTALGEQVIRSAYIPLHEIPVPHIPTKTKGVLVVDQDVSEVYFEREHRISTLKQLVATLVNLVDKRDPFSANHSFLVSEVAHKIAVNMGLDEGAIDTTKTAASLMNIGKILVPKVLLTKTTALNNDEKNTIRESMETAGELLKNIPFDGAVAQTISEWQEKWDGSGRLGLTGDEIIISARIIAVANAFIGMVSPRSWRDAMSIDSANKFLLEQADIYFDKKVVIALANYVENQSGRAWLNEILLK